MPELGVEVFVQIAGEDVPAGRLWSHRRRGVESGTFSYNPSYIAREDSYPLDPMLPLASGTIHTPAGREIFGAFSDCAPDGWGRMLIRRRLGKSDSDARGESLAEIDFLLGVRDDLRQGALRLKREEGEEFLAPTSEGVPDLVDLPELMGLAARAEKDVADERELDILLHRGSSLGGARPKVHVRDPEGRISIAKFPRPERDDWNVIAWEGVALELAREAGIRVPDSALHDIGGNSVLVINRFDRRGETRIGYVSAMTMLEEVDMNPRSYLDIVEAIEESAAEASRDIRELWRRVAFSILIRNTDDHLRNHGFLREGGGGWSLSPAFDLNPNPGPDNRNLSTSIDDSTNEASLELLLECAELFRLGEGEARRVLGQVSEATSGWERAAQSARLDRREVARMRPAFEHDSARLAAELSPAGP